MEEIQDEKIAPLALLEILEMTEVHEVHEMTEVQDHLLDRNLLEIILNLENREMINF